MMRKLKKIKLEIFYFRVHHIDQLKEPKLSDLKRASKPVDHIKSICTGTTFFLIVNMETIIIFIKLLEQRIRRPSSLWAPRRPTSVPLPSWLCRRNDGVEL